MTFHQEFICVSFVQLLSYISLDVTLCALSQLSRDWPSVLEELLRAATRGFEVGHFTLMAEMVRMLLPQGEMCTCDCVMPLNTHFCFSHP